MKDEDAFALKVALVRADRSGQGQLSSVLVGQFMKLHGLWEDRSERLLAACAVPNVHGIVNYRTLLQRLG